MKNNHDMILQYERNISNYEENGKYQYFYDMFYLEHFYPHFNYIQIHRFIELVRYLCKNFLITEYEMITQKLNIHLLEKQIP